MKVILTNNISNLGRINAVIAVKDGYARNYLLPRGLAMPYSSSLAAKIEKLNSERQKLREEIISNASHYADQVSKIGLVFVEKASAKGVLYGSVTADMIAQKLIDEHKIHLEAGDIKIDGGHLKNVGEHIVKVKLGGLEASLRVGIKAE
ncbi:MAG: 50S ribosomal protein L9 [Patescibacteria group bacterium]|nr:50S ribosomal protein L9 [Patescibacteria group bacterium]